MGNNKEISEEMATGIVKEFIGNTMYMLLSTVQANMVRGYSFPYVQQIDENGKVIFFFSSLEYAKEFVEDNNFEILDGIYPLAKIEPDDKVTGFEPLCAVAAHLGIMYIDFNPGHPNMSMGVTIPWIQKQFNYDFTKITMLLSPAMKEEVDKREDGKVPVCFSPMAIADFKDPYSIDKDERTELDELPDKYADSVEDYFDAIKGLSLTKLVYISNLLNKGLIPKANSEGNKTRVDMLIAMLHVLDSVIIQHLNRNRIFTLLDGEDIFVNHNQASYLIYTDRFQYMGEYRYKEVKLESFLDQIEDEEVSYVIVTAGPGQMHITTTKAIRETLNKIK